ncbi:lysylphosphatidylglycerol synthase transmembrane domain-containing protein [soil metagenome]
MSRLGRRVPKQARAHAARLRIVLGIALSLLFLAITVAGIDLPLVGSFMLAASPLWLAAAVAFVAADVGVRAFRWRTLLGGIASVRYRLALAFLCIGYFANALLPARLGDVARAYLAGNAFLAPRLATLGTIMIERLSDGLIMLATVIVAGALVPTAGAIRDTAIALLFAGLAGLLVLSVGLVVARRTRAESTRFGALVEGLISRVMAGTVALRTIGGAVRVVGATAVGLVTAILIVSSVAAAVGLELSPLQAAVVTAGLALSMAIPAAPGSLGTYEFVGVSILVGLGFPAEASLATIMLVHVIATVPPALAGMVSMWFLHLRVGTIVARADPAEAAVP